MAAPFARLAHPPGLRPMEAKTAAAIPPGPGWQYEPKWDGFRCLAFRDGGAVALGSKSGKPLERYFPEIAAALAELADDRLVLDGELVLPVGTVLSFAHLQLRLHPAASRIARLARETPARLILFDCLQRGGEVLVERPLAERRAALEELMARAAPPRLVLSPTTRDPQVARGWFARAGGALDGVVAKRLDAPYRPGERAMVKVKQQRTADCVVGGYRPAKAGDGVGSLLLGLYDRAGRLDYVGFASSFDAATRADLLATLRPFAGEAGFTGSAPGGPSRWSKGESVAWVPLRPELVAEVGYDQVTGGRFRHGTTFLRWRPDKAPGLCTLDQLELESAALLSVSG